MTTKIIQVKVDSNLKEEAENILQTLDITPSQAINALYTQIVLCGGMPFGLKLPNKISCEAVEELEKGGGKRFRSFKSMIDDSDEG